MHISTLDLFILWASLLTHQVAGGKVVPRGCVLSNETASGLACPAPPGLDNNTTRRKAMITGGLTQINDSSLMGDNFDWSVLGPPYTPVSSPTQSVMSVMLVNSVAASLTSGDFQRLDQNDGWAGTFPSGMPLLWNQNMGSVTLQFSHPISAFVTYVQADDYGLFGATITAYDITNTTIGSVSITDDALLDPGLLLPIGATATTPISYVTLGLDFAQISVNSFAFGTFYFNELSGSATSDPHLVGASGLAFEFNGQPGNTYSLFSAPQYQVAMHLAGDGPGTHFMTQIGILFKGEEFFLGESTMTEEFRVDLEARITRLGASLLEWSSYHVKLAICPGHVVSITQMHTTYSWLVRADGSPYNYYDVEVVVPSCHDAYDGALGQTYKCKYEGGEKIVWSHEQEEFFHLPTLFTPSGSYSAETSCDVKPTGAALKALMSGASPRHQRRGLMSGAGKLVETQAPAPIFSAEGNHNVLSSQPLRRYRKPAGSRTAEAQGAK